MLIGGAACDILFARNEGQFRATRDLDMVLIVEALTSEFGEKFWEFIEDGKYRNKATNLGKNDILRIATEFVLEKMEELPESIHIDMKSFIEKLKDEPFEKNLLKGYGLSNTDVLVRLQQLL